MQPGRHAQRDADDALLLGAPQETRNGGLMDVEPIGDLGLAEARTVVEARHLRHEPEFVDAVPSGALSSRPVCGRCARARPRRCQPCCTAPVASRSVGHARLEAGHRPRQPRQRVSRRPDADGQAGEPRRAERRQVGGIVALDGTAEDVGLKLHERVVAAGAAVGQQRRQRAPASARIASNTSRTW